VTLLLDSLAEPDEQTDAITAEFRFDIELREATQAAELSTVFRRRRSLG
jgi:hypothetical protein